MWSFVINLEKINSNLLKQSRPNCICTTATIWSLVTDTWCGCGYKWRPETILFISFLSSSNMLMSKPPTFDHVTAPTSHHTISNQGLYQSRHDRYKSDGRVRSKIGKTPHFHNQSVLSNSSAMNFYPQFLQPTRMSDIIGAGSSNGSSNRAPSTRTSMKYSSSQSTAKTVSFYRSGDVYMQVCVSVVSNS